jgi:excisionase family DNA binding protein
MTASPTAPFLGLHEVADLLGVHYMTAYRYVRTGRLEAAKEGGQWIVARSAFDAFLQTPDRREQPSLQRVARSRVERLKSRLLAGDRRGALQVVEDALAGGASWSEIQVDLLAPALESVGDGWEAGELSVGDEHRATVVAQHVLAVLSTRFGRRGRRRGTVVVGAPPGEPHQIPVTIVADHLRAAGFEVIDFGADTPADAFATTAAETAPVAVVIGATAPRSTTGVRRVIRAVRAHAPDVPVLAGGAAIAGPDAARRLGADDWTGPDARAVVEAVEQLKAHSPGPRADGSRS